MKALRIGDCIAKIPIIQGGNKEAYRKGERNRSRYGNGTVGTTNCLMHRI